MKTMLIVLITVLALATGAAAKAAPSGTIVLNEPGPYAFQDEITFTVTTSGLKGYQYPMVYVLCTSVVDGQPLYGQLAHPEETFVLGGGSSQWYTQRDDANCTATLYAYEGLKKNAQITQLAAPISFSASA